MKATFHRVRTGVIDRRRGPWLRGAMGLALVGVLAFAPPAARAEVPITRDRGLDYYVPHAGAVVLLLSGSLALRHWGGDHGPRYDADWFPGDLAIRARFNETAANRSDVTLWLATVAPAFAHAGLGFDQSLQNSALVYLEANAGQAFLNTLVKHTVARPRPYTHRRHAQTKLRERAGSEAFVSFYSGHTGLSFTSATAGSYLLSARGADPWSRRLVWSSELALAGATASFRIVAGQHYVSDVLTGVVVGTAFGIGTPLLHGYAPPSDLETDIAWGLGGLAVGAVLPWLIGGNENVTAPLGSEMFTWSLAAGANGEPGLTLAGEF